jgi:hypothetical protein
MATDPLSLDLGRDKKFCVYLYRDPRRGKKLAPIYVGKGLTISRPDAHWRHGSHNTEFNDILAALKKAKLEPICEYIGFFDDENAALALEKTLIKRIGRRHLGSGPLVNISEGGKSGPGTLRRSSSSATQQQIEERPVPQRRGFGGLIHWDDFVDKYLPLSNGARRGKRSRQKIARAHGFQLIRLGWNSFVDEEFEAQRLREISQRDMLPRGPGRPRKHLTAVGESKKIRRPRSPNRGSDAALPVIAASGDDGSLE